MYALNSGLEKRPARTRQNQRGVTLIEILVVMALILILIAMILPTLQKAKVRAKRAACLSQLRQQGIAFHIFAHEHESKFPMQVSTNNGGSLEFLRLAANFSGEFYFSFRHYQSLSRELDTPKILVCPADIRQPAESFADLRNTNISYFIAASADYAQPDTILAGDRNIAGLDLVSRSILRLTADDLIGWTGEMHQYAGNLLFSDSHAEQTDKKGLRNAFQNSPGETIVLTPLPEPSPSSSTTDASRDGGRGSGASASAGTGSAGAGSGSASAGSGSASAGSGSASAGSGSAGAGSGSASAGSGSANQNVARPTDADGPAVNSAKPASTPTPSKLRTARPKERAETPSRMSATNESSKLSASRGPSRAEPRAKVKDAPPAELALMIGQFFTSLGARIAYLLLLLLLAVLIYLEIQRRKRMRKKRAGILKKRWG